MEAPRVQDPASGAYNVLMICMIYTALNDETLSADPVAEICPLIIVTHNLTMLFTEPGLTAANHNVPLCAQS